VRSAGFELVEIKPWWERFDLVWAVKPTARLDDGASSTAGPRGTVRPV
jgi:hypothetical protein